MHLDDSIFYERGKRRFVHKIARLKPYLIGGSVITYMQSQQNSVQDMVQGVVMISRISKCGGRLVIGIPKPNEGDVKALLHKPARITIEPLL